MAGPLVQVQDATKTYRLGEQDVVALAGVTVDVMPGEFTVFAGPSGSGKSTLLNLVGCLDRPSSGTVRLEGHDVETLDDESLGAIRARRVGFVFQSFNLVPVLTALENVELALRLAGGSADTFARAEQALVDVGLGAFLTRRPAQLSGGQQQRVAIARALVKAPALVVADEPTANLDSRNGAAILDLMRRMNEEQHVTFLFSTHDPQVMERARRIVRLTDGRIVSDSAAGGG
jgi:putative ABC transport system ATP-binding protein